MVVLGIAVGGPVTPPPRFRAILKHSFELTGRGTALCVDIVEGKVSAGDVIVVPSASGARTVIVRSVEFVDFDIGKPTAHAEVALMVSELRPNDVVIGQELHAAVV